MTQNSLTVPPPQTSDHEDVAWALRAASAQWRRDAYSDAIAWVERAAETAEEVGAAGRSIELLQLAEKLRRGSLAADPSAILANAVPRAGAEAVAPPPPFGAVAPPLPPAVAPPPPAGAVAPPPPAGAVAPPPPGIRLPSAAPVEVDFDEDEVEFLDDADEIVSLDDELAAEIPDLGGVEPVGEAPSLEVGSSDEVEFGDLDFEDGAESTTEFTPSVEPDAHLLGATAGEDAEFGELDFVDEQPTQSRSVTPSVREVEPPSYRPTGSESFDLSTPAEIVMSQRAPHRGQEPEDIERELGIDLSLNVAPAPRTRTEPKPERPGSNSPVGMASVRPSRPPGASDRIVSPGLEPFLEAPSALAPDVAPFAMEPPSRPSQAPPPESMREPEPDQEPVLALPDDSEPSGAIPSTASTPAASIPSAAPIPEKARPPEPLLVGPGAAPHDAPPSSRSSPYSRRSSLPPRTGGTWIDGLDVLEIPGLQDLPEDALGKLLAHGEIHKLKHGEEVNAFGVALVTSGAVQLMPSIADAACALARKGEVIFTKGSLDTGVELRVVGYDPGTRVVSFSKEAFDAATSACPWVVDELASVADRFQALAGAVLGPLGDSLDDLFRGMVLDKCSVKRPLVGEVIATRGKPMNGFYVVGAGSLELVGADGSVTGTLSGGDFLFPATILSASPAPETARVGAGGALLLYIDRMSAHELLATCPPFIELLAS